MMLQGFGHGDFEHRIFVFRCRTCPNIQYPRENLDYKTLNVIKKQMIFDYATEMGILISPEVLNFLVERENWRDILNLFCFKRKFVLIKLSDLDLNHKLELHDKKNL